MGSGRNDAEAYGSYSAGTSSRTVHDYARTTVRKDFVPKEIKVRESVKSALNPHPTPIIIGLDVTGSMGSVVEAMRRGLGTLFEQVITRDPVSDPHVLAMAIGDMDTDRFPVQATQFESESVVIGKQIEELTIEGNGGGNDHESYLGPLYFALMRTKCDAFSETPKRKGYIFTVGDEQPQQILTAAQIEKWFGGQPKQDYTAAELIATVEQNWHVFHLIVGEGSHQQRYADITRKEWNVLLGQRAMLLSDHTKMSEVIISTIEVVNGKDIDAVTKSWSGDTSLVVRDAIKGLVPGSAGAGAGPISL